MRSKPASRLRVALVVAGLAASTVATRTQPAAVPSIDDILNLKRVGGPAISPSGQQAAYTIRETNWDENAYETEIWIGDAATGQSRQVTNSRKSSTPTGVFSDGAWLGFISDRDGKRQVFRIALRGGEAERLTSADESVNSFAWSPDGKSIAFTMVDPMSEALKEREKRWGDIKIEDQDQRYTHLYVFDIAAKTVKQVTKGSFVVGSFDWSPDSRQIAYDHRATSDPADGGSADISVVLPATLETRVVVAQEGPDSNPRWSPDGSQVAFVSSMGKPNFYYANSVIATIAPGSASVRSLTGSFDEDPNLIAWTKAGIHFSASQHTWSYLFTISPETKQITKHAVRDEWSGGGFSLTPDGATAAFAGTSGTEFADVYIAPLQTMAAKRVSDLGVQIASWPKHTRDVITWKSQDGVAIEGVLHKPADFQSGRRYPLLIVIHGGPTGVSRPVPYGSGTAYPIDAFLAKGAIVLEPNYRGSAGYGDRIPLAQRPQPRCWRHVGRLSGSTTLCSRGMVDSTRDGSNGLVGRRLHFCVSYYPAFDRFKAISVGAGISRLGHLLRQHGYHSVHARNICKSTPWDDPKVYAETSPMTYIKQARHRR